MWFFQPLPSSHPNLTKLPFILSDDVRIHSFIHFISQNTSYIKTMKNKHTKSVP